MAVINKNKDFIKLVSSYSVETFNQTPGNGKIWDIYKIVATMPNSADIKTEIKWGTEVIFVAHGNWPEEKTEIQVTGDGSKVLSMRLVNDSSQSETMRLSMHAEEQG